MNDPAIDPGPRRVRRDEQVASADDLEAGPGTYLDGRAIRARFDGELAISQGSCSVRRERRAIPNRRRRRGEGSGDDSGSRRDATGTKKAGTHRHGLGKHGRLRGKTRRGRGDQGAWN